MRTLTEMTTMVRRYVNDGNSDEWTDAQVQEELKYAAWELWGDLLGNLSGRKVLRKFSAGFDFVADQSQYAVVEHGSYGVADMSLLDGVQVRFNSTDEWVDIERRESVFSGSSSRNGTEVWLAAADENQGVSVPGLKGMYWLDDTDPGYIRIMPEFGSVADQQFRFRYFCTPVFPGVAGGSLDDPDADGTAEYVLPAMCDAAIEHLAAAKLKGHEVTEKTGGRKLSYHQGEYRQLVASIAQTTSGLVRPPRRYIRRVSKR